MNPFSALMQKPRIALPKSPRCCGMSKTHAARKLLEHGPMTRQEFIEVTGWKARQCETVIYGLRMTAQVVAVRDYYALAAVPQYTDADAMRECLEAA